MHVSQPMNVQIICEFSLKQISCSVTLCFVLYFLVLLHSEVLPLACPSTSFFFFFLKKKKKPFQQGRKDLNLSGMCSFLLNTKLELIICGHSPIHYLAQCRERTSGCIWIGSASHVMPLLFIAGCSGMKQKHFQGAHSHIDGT